MAKSDAQISLRLSKKLKESTGLSFQELLIKMRMERAAALLREYFPTVIIN